MFIKKKIVFKEINFFDLSYIDIKKNIKKGGLLVIPSGPGLSTLEKERTGKKNLPSFFKYWGDFSRALTTNSVPSFPARQDVSLNQGEIGAISSEIQEILKESHKN